MKKKTEPIKFPIYRHPTIHNYVNKEGKVVFSIRKAFADGMQEFLMGKYHYDFMEDLNFHFTGDCSTLWHE